MLRRFSNRQNHEYISVSDSETESDDLDHCFNAQSRKRKNIEGKNKENELFEKSKKNKNENTFDEDRRSDIIKASKQEEPDAVIQSSAKRYQEYMKQIPVPSAHGSAIRFVTWQDLAKSISQLYEQPLHYLTHILLKQWDESRSGTVNEKKPMDSIIHPARAEATVWGIEEFHRHCSSPDHLAKLWHSDPMYHDFFNQINRPIMSKVD